MNRKTIAVLLHAFIGWAMCAATMGIGMATMEMKTALIVHAIGAPVFFAIVSRSYFKMFNYTTPLQTALIFVGFVMLVDFFVVALLIMGNLDMFKGWLGTWIPFILIFLSTYLTGVLTTNTMQARTIS